MSGGGRTPLFEAQHSERYARQQLITNYEEITGADLIVMIDQIFPYNMTYLEELLHNCNPQTPTHLLLASPGGDGETAIRIVRSIQSRCTELSILIPDMAKSAATILCLGADKLIFGPGGDLGPVDPQMRFANGTLASAKEIVEAVAEAEQRITANPNTFPLFANLLSDVNMLMIEEARSALHRSEALVKEALASNSSRTPDEVGVLAANLQSPLIEDPASHSAVIPVGSAQEFGLPAFAADSASDSWQIVWALWTRYFGMGAFPEGNTGIYESKLASHILRITG